MTTPMISGLAPRTNWDQYGLADIWDMVKHEDGATTSEHVRAWAIMHELCDGQATRLQAAAATLAQHWPPERSPAAEIFVARLREMADIFSTAAAAAGRNSGAVQNLTMGLLETRGRVKELREAWRHWEGQQAKRVAEARRLIHMASPFAPDLPDEQLLAASNIEPGKTLVDLSGAPDVPTDWRRRLDQQARDVMKVSERDLNETRSRIQRPPVLTRGDLSLHVWPPSGGTDSAEPGSLVGPPGSGGANVGARSLDIPAPTFKPPVPSPGRSPWMDTDPADQPLLSGGPTDQQPPAGPSPTAAPGPSVGPSPPGGSWGDARAPLVGPGGLIGGRVPADTAPNGATSGRPSRSPGSPVLMSPAGAAKSAAAPFVAPPGGLIGGRPASAATGVPVAGRRRRRHDPPEDWAVPEGVPAVLTPTADPDDHLPGPGVLGIDR